MAIAIALTAAIAAIVTCASVIAPNTAGLSTRKDSLKNLKDE